MKAPRQQDHAAANVAKLHERKDFRIKQPASLQNKTSIYKNYLCNYEVLLINNSTHITCMN